MFEHHHEPVVPLSRFIARMGWCFGLALAIDTGALAVGGVAFRTFENLTWTDSLLNAALVLTGNGPIARMETRGGQIFLLLYAMLGVIVFAAVVSVVMVPILHRALHALHATLPPDEESRS